MGAIGEGGVRVVSRDIVRSVGATDEDVAEVEMVERAELERRARHFRGDRTRADLTGKTAIVVDDGIATGATARAACQVVRALGASRIVLATPVAPPGLEHRLADVADEFVCLDRPRHFAAVGQFYDDFDQTTDAQVDRRARPGRCGEPARSCVTTEGRRSPGDRGVPRGHPRSLKPMRVETGLAVLHLFCVPEPHVDREAADAAVKAAVAADAQVVVSSILGHKCDVAVMALHPDWTVLRGLQSAPAGGRPEGGRQLRQHHRGQRVRQGDARAHAPASGSTRSCRRRASRCSASTR